MTRTVDPAWLLLCVPLLAACDAQASTAYRGEALLTMTGRVEIKDDPTEGRLIPALAFVNYEHSAIHIAEVAVEGEFPSKFTLRVYDPPADDVLAPVPDQPDDDLRLASGYITAVTEAHPDVVTFADSAFTTVRACAGSDCGCPPEGCVTVEDEVCTNDGASCYTETKTCPKSDSPPEDCTVTHSGNKEITEDPWKHFAGLSQNYAIVYVTKPIEAHSDLAYELGLSGGLAQGYTLLALREFNDDELGEQAACLQQAEDETVAQFNDQLGNPAKTPQDIESLHLKLEGLGCVGTCDPSTDPACDASRISPECLPLDHKLVEAFPEALAKRQRKLHCLPEDATVKKTPVADPAHESITVRIAPDVSPIGGPSEEEGPTSSPLAPMMTPPVPAP